MAVQPQQCCVMRPVLWRIGGAEADGLDEQLPRQPLAAALVIGERATPQDIRLILANGIEPVEPSLKRESELAQSLQRADQVPRTFARRVSCALERDQLLASALASVLGLEPTRETALGRRG